METGLQFVQDVVFQMSQWRPQVLTGYAMVVVSALAAALMTRVLGGIHYVTGVVGFVVMYLSAYFANFVARDVVMPSVDAFQRGIVFSICGQMFGAIIMLIIFKLKETTARR